MAIPQILAYAPPKLPAGLPAPVKLDGPAAGAPPAAPNTSTTRPSPSTAYTSPVAWSTARPWSFLKDPNGGSMKLCASNALADAVPRDTDASTIAASQPRDL